MRLDQASEAYLTSIEGSRWLASFLSGSWRTEPPPLAVSQSQLERIAPLLCDTGAGGLGWTLVRDSSLCETPAARQLREAYRVHRLHAAWGEAEIKKLFSILRANRIEPLLLKGWANARLYPDKGSRPYGDCDLAIRPELFRAAIALFGQPLPAKPHASFIRQGHHVELHGGATDLVDRHDKSSSTIFKRSVLADLDGVDVRILCPEDHLRLICIHFLRHGGGRPLWLCDIAALVESRPSNFNWSRCLGAHKRRADWVACAIGIAHQLLGLNIENTPVAWRARNLPGWLVPAVLRTWRRPRGVLPMFAETPLSQQWRYLPARWPDPIAATIQFRRDFTQRSPLPWQALSLIRRRLGCVG